MSGVYVTLSFVPRGEILQIYFFIRNMKITIVSNTAILRYSKHLFTITFSNKGDLKHVTIAFFFFFFVFLVIKL